MTRSEKTRNEGNAKIDEDALGNSHMLTCTTAVCIPSQADSTVI